MTPVSNGGYGVKPWAIIVFGLIFLVLVPEVIAWAYFR